MTYAWKVQALGGRFGWVNIVDRLSREVADETAARLANDWPNWELRLLNEDTAEIVYYVRETAA